MQFNGNTDRPCPCGGRQRLRAALVALAVALFWLGAASAADLSHALRVPAGFVVDHFADDELAHDVFTLTFDARGRVVVSGPGYVRILIDEDGDGRADRAHLFAPGPRTGAQGMYFDGADLYCVGDEGVLRYRDADQDDTADGPPELMFPLRTGGEHHAHALRRGPDGWWYLLVGNDTGIGTDHANGASLVRTPQAGALLRLSPDFSISEVYTDGYRNAYDFDFHPYGHIFVWDSDGERDVSLPWYQPTRVLEARPGSSAGWVSRSWKWPDYFPDMAPVVARLGRGSPTGVVMYRHQQFPDPYQNALLVADWTFGRVVALPLLEDAATAAWHAEPLELVRGVGQFGFAPTDLDVGPAGDLYISVGGRGTRGGVYRVRWSASETGERPVPSSPPTGLLLAQPLSSWSRAACEAMIEQRGTDWLRSEVLAETASVAARVRAIELLTEYGEGLDAEMHTALEDAPAAIRARAAWSLGRTAINAETTTHLALYLRANEPRVLLAALESQQVILTTSGAVVRSDSLLSCMSHPAPAVRALAAGVLHAGGVRALPPVEATVAARLTALRGRVERPGKADPEVLWAAAALWEQSADAPQRLEILRIMQLALGDMGPRDGRAAVFDGYASRLDLPPRADREPVMRQLESWLGTATASVDNELARVAAMLEIDSPVLLAALLARITPDSSPIDDLHYLIAAARVAGPLSAAQRQRIARGLTELEPKLAQRGWPQDRNWEPRVGELCAAWLERDGQLVDELLDAPAFGDAGHAAWIQYFAADQQTRAAERFAQQLAAHPERTLGGPVARLLLASNDESYEALVRQRAETGDARRELIRFVAARARPADRALIVEGLSGWPAEITAECLKALQRLPVAHDADELGKLLALVRAWRQDPALRDQSAVAARLLARASGESYGLSFEPPNRFTRARWTVAEAGWLKWLRAIDPQAVDAFEDRLGRVDVSQRLGGVPWEAGVAQRGADLFARKCSQCHGGRTALGPDLAGITTRFSREDLFTAIFLPDRDVSSRYTTTVIETRDGRVYQGAVIYESVDGVTLLTAAQETVRIEAADLASRQVSPRSLMPAGLLDEATPTDLADLYEYLSRSQQQAAGGGP